jgi:hypothetical protein
MKRYEYSFLNRCGTPIRDLVKELSDVGKQGWRIRYEIGDNILLERELADNEPGSDDTSGPVTLNEDVAFYGQPVAANTDPTPTH